MMIVKKGDWDKRSNNQISHKKNILIDKIEG